ncbi:MAG: polysaccharide deacetylase family protein [Patescibacteria group bacterium]
MKKSRIKFLIALLTFGLGLLFSTQIASAAPSANLLANPSLETSTGTPAAPASWTSNKWGTNTTVFTYDTTGRTGTKSVTAKISAFTSGDAKWSANAVTVTPGTQYTYSDYYKATVTTRYTVEYTSTAGAVTYQELATAPAAPTTWAQGVRTFTPPAGTATARVYHLIDAVGELSIDDASLTYETAPPPPQTGNLVPNPSLETSLGSPAAPANWVSSKWGTNTTSFTYPTNGRTGTRSVQIQITSRTDGDAKWYFEPVTVQPNKSYDVTSYYKSTVPTRTVMATFDAAGNPTYTDLTGVVPTSTSIWSPTSKTVITPANAVKMSVYHVLEAVGTLQVDDMSVVLTPTVPPSSNPVPNPSFELSSGVPAAPSSWIKSKWGTNTATYGYIGNDGHTGTKSAKVTVTNYVDGDAKWYPQPITSLVAGNQYRYTAWYKTNTRVQAVVMFTMTDGTVKYFGMPQPFPGANPSTTWQKYTETFTVPAGTASVAPFLFVASNGFVQIDDVSIENYTPTGFTRPLVTLTFDDGHEDNATTALPAMNTRNIKSTQCFATQYIQESTVAQQAVLKFRDTGHEICSHTITHPFLTQQTAAMLTTEVKNSQTYLKTLTGAPVKNFASPYGDYNQAVNTELKKYYRSHRTVDEGYNSKDNFDAYRVRVQNMTPTVTLAQYKAWIEQAKATKTWLVLVYHRITPTGTTPDAFDTPLVNFTPQMDALVSSGVTVKTYDAALDELVPQI